MLRPERPLAQLVSIVCHQHTCRAASPGLWLQVPPQCPPRGRSTVWEQKDCIKTPVCATEGPLLLTTEHLGVRTFLIFLILGMPSLSCFRPCRAIYLGSSSNALSLRKSFLTPGAQKNWHHTVDAPSASTALAQQDPSVWGSLKPGSILCSGPAHMMQRTGRLSLSSLAGIPGSAPLPPTRSGLHLSQYALSKRFALPPH